MTKNRFCIYCEPNDFLYTDSNESKSYWNYFFTKVKHFVTKENLDIILLIFDNSSKTYIENFISTLFKLKDNESQTQITILQPKACNPEHIFNSLSYLKDEEEQYTFFLNALYPMFSIEKNSFMLRDAPEYFIEYYYGEGFFEGYVGELIKNTIIPELIKLTTPHDIVKHNFIFDILLRNISLFDIDFVEGFELYLDYRSSLSINDPVNIPLIRYLYTNELDQRNTDISFFNNSTPMEISLESIEQKIIKNPLSLKTIPKTIILEISSKCNFECIHCPYPRGLKRNRDFLTLQDIKDFFSANQKYLQNSVFIIGGFGEPLLNPEFIDIVNFISKTNTIYIETNGSYLSEKHFQSFEHSKNVKVIIMVDSATEETYKKLGKKYMFGYLMNQLDKFLSLFPDMLYIQFIRMKDNDSEVEAFYQRFEKFEKNIVFRKYNSYSQYLEDREAGDLTPINRFPCYHLRRDLFILSDGIVAQCYSDFNGELLNKTFKDSLETILSDTDKKYCEHVENKLPTICKQCNEFYTYFF